MKSVLLPDTDILISRLSFGTASLHHLPTSRRRQALLAAAVDHGFTHLDTAPYYGFGLTELEVGKFLATRPSKITVASKVGLYPPGGLSSQILTVWSRKLGGKCFPQLSMPIVDWSVKSASISLENSLKRLGKDCVDFLLLHEPIPGLIETDEFKNWLKRQRDCGKLRFWGLAGLAEQFEPWIREVNSLARVLQLRDRAGDNVSRILNEAGRSFQITYGYLSSPHVNNGNYHIKEVIKYALSKNRVGSILVSTRCISHLGDLVSAVER